MKRYPPLVHKIGALSHAFVVGSAATNKDSRDIDVVVPLKDWRRVAPQLPLKNGKCNSMGGWKLHIDGVEIDVWPDDPTRFLFKGPMRHIASGTLYGEIK